MRHPIVIVPACTRKIGAHPNHCVQSKYLDAVALGAQCVPMVLPALGAATDFDTVLGAADGILLTGSESNVHPSHYAQSLREREPALAQDPARDATTLPLIRAALARGMPLFAVCRGFQEVNVALGGSLHQAVHEVAGMMDHREVKDQPLEDQYGAAHSVALVAGGLLSRILGGAAAITVNSLHGQGVDRLAPGLRAEARAGDGLVEAFSLTAGAAAAADPAFALAVQWHPEWRMADNPDSLKLFRAFGQACRDYRGGRGSCA